MSFSSSALTYPKREPVEQKMVNESQSFHDIAGRAPGVIVRGCTLNPSGCTDWGKSLKAEFPKMESMGLQMHNVMQFAIPEYHLESAPLHPSSWEYIVITGCVLSESATIVSALKQAYDLGKVKDIYAIVPPHLESSLSQSLTSKIAHDFDHTPYKIHILYAGFDITHAGHMGMPKLYPAFTSTYKINDNCYGLLYHRQPLDEGYSYLHNYFKQVAIAGKACKKSTLSVLAIATNEYERMGISSIAEQYRVGVIYLDKLPQADFLKAIQDIGKKGGVISADGAYTLMQAIALGAKAFAHNSEYNLNNTRFYRQLVQSLPSNQRDIAEVILGQSKEFDLLNNADDQIAEIFTALRASLKNGVDKFESDHTHRFFKSTAQLGVARKTDEPVTEKSYSRGNN